VNKRAAASTPKSGAKVATAAATTNNTKSYRISRRLPNLSARNPVPSDPSSMPTRVAVPRVVRTAVERCHWVFSGSNATDIAPRS
jgi:hypothetical protein